VLRLPLLRLLERAAAVLRRLGLGGLVDRVRGRALAGLGDFSETVGDVTLAGDVALHSHYVRQLQAGDRERGTAEQFSDAIAEGAVVLDLGAYLGYFTVLAGKRGARVIAFEPDPRTLPYLRRNVESNGLSDRVRIVESAVGAERGSATFFLSPGGDESTLHPHTRDQDAVTVQVTPVDAETEGLAVDVIKMDVEGAEVEALAGMRRTLDAASPGLVMFVERSADTLGRAGHVPEELDQALRERGFRLEIADQDDAREYANLLCRRG
jgi:FkbM family methyltransferase